MMDNEELQHWLDHTNALISELIEDGTNEEVHHTIEHHFASTDFDLLEKAAITAFKMGHEIEEPEEAELESGEKVFSFDIVTEQALEIWIPDFIQRILDTLHDGKYNHSYYQWFGYSFYTYDYMYTI